MIYPLNFEDKIGFTAVRSFIASRVLCPLGMKRLDELQMSTNYEHIRTELGKASEMKGILMTGVAFPASDYLDLSSMLHYLAIQGTYPQVEDLVELKLSLEALLHIKRFLLKQPPDAAPKLADMAAAVEVPQKILQHISRLVDERGRIRDGASQKLKQIRNKLVDKHKETDRKLASILSAMKKQHLTAEESEITIRNGRQVIPVHAANKRKIRGFIHDESATGQTFYIEPDEVFEINNQIRELVGAEKREIIHILTAFADDLRPAIPVLLHAYDFLGEIDFIRAKALFALEINAQLPKLTEKPLIDWVNATHPLLYLSLKTQQKKVVPLSITLDHSQRILVVSGPNAGGKSVALKTIGLLQYMLQCGLLIPVEDQSSAGVFEKIFIDIGDEQSVENDLSTYTSHLRNLKHFIENADAGTLVMIDEFGTGTEPQLGGAIAEATLEHLASKGCLGVVTTHYANLKEAAGKISGVFNGAMLFESRTLSPLFRLAIGRPGSSFAFEIASKIGFPSDVLQVAASKTGTTSVDYDRLLQDLETEKSELSERQRAARMADDFLNELIQRYERMASELKRDRQAILQKARAEAAEILRRTNQTIERAVREIKESQADRQRVKVIRQELAALREEVSIIADQEPKEPLSGDHPAKMVESFTPETGTMVTLRNQQTVGKVLEIRENEVLVEAGNIILHVHPAMLQKAPPGMKSSPSEAVSSSRTYNDLNDKVANFKLSIDLRGKKAEEVSAILIRYIDDAVLLNIPEVTIIHGKGDGVLRQVVRNYLKTNPGIKSMSDGHADRGGHGITIVSFNR